MAGFPARFQDAVDELVGHLVQVLVGPGALQDLQGLDARDHGEGVAGKSTSLVHGASRSHLLHDVPAATVGPDGKTTTDHLAHGRHVRGYTEVLLGAAVCDAESSHHLVEDQESTVLGGELTQALEELLGGRDKARVANHRLKDHGGALMLLEEGLYAVQVVVLGNQSVLRGAPGHTRGIWEAKGGHTTAGLHQEAIRVAVVAPVELDHLLPARVGTD
mmetsp:Transcript_7109/g.20580  ORF Transcript_7109/g.20580 Transcript_7109/m.20580 type:complete len:218 (-) Transcript_7109:519-1172(-)